MEIWLIKHFIPLCGLLLSLYAGWRIWDYSWKEEKYLRKCMKEADDDVKHRWRQDMTFNTAGFCFPALFFMMIGLFCAFWLFCG